MAEWRIGRGWSEAELQEHLAEAKRLPRNFSNAPEEMTIEHGWHQYYSEAIVAQGKPGAPSEDGPFKRGCQVVERYAFSDPDIVIGHFEPDVPLMGRPMLLEMRALRVLHYLGGVVVSATRSEEADDQSIFGFRYDTLEGHIERGIEWFLLTKEHESGAIRFRIEAAWQSGQFPNWWSRLGFSWLGPSYQKKWHRRAHVLLATLIREPALEAGMPSERRLVHSDLEIEFKRRRARYA